MILLPSQWIKHFQMTPKNLRLAAILISIYEILIAHVIMFIMLLGLINAEKAQKLLQDDIVDQQEMEDYYYYPAVNNKGETLDIVRLNSATKLASSTIVKLTIGTTIATVYLLVCLGLFAGIIKNRSNMIIPWMIFDVLMSLVINSVLVLVGSKYLYEYFSISNWQYWTFCITYSIADLSTWCIIFQYYSIIKQMSKLREEAVITCPTPIAPYYYRENLYDGHNGLRHTICDSEYNYVA